MNFKILTISLALLLPFALNAMEKDALNVSLWLLKDGSIVSQRHMRYTIDNNNVLTQTYDQKCVTKILADVNQISLHAIQVTEPLILPSTSTIQMSLEMNRSEYSDNQWTHYTPEQMKAILSLNGLWVRGTDALNLLYIKTCTSKLDNQK